jgi:ecotin
MRWNEAGRSRLDQTSRRGRLAWSTPNANSLACGILEKSNIKTSMNITKLTVASGVLAAVIVVATTAAEKAGAEAQLKAFPPAEKGMVRHVLVLSHETDESACKVELIAGKSVMGDANNRQFFSGKIQEKTVQGWGYTYHVVDLKDTPMGSTLMAPGPSVQKFIALGGPPHLIPYNSKLPVVVYAPEGVEVRYRLWKAEPEQKPMPPG